MAKYILIRIYIYNTSNMAYSLLGRCLIEKIHPLMTYQTYAEKYILQPLNMTNIGFDFTKE